jgi:orotate phosphoribosyltransferase-like protein
MALISARGPEEAQIEADRPALTFPRLEAAMGIRRPAGASEAEQELDAAWHLQAIMRPGALRYAGERVARMVASTGWEFDSIAFRGLSGALVAPLVCVLLNKWPIAVRKEHEKAHSSHVVEGFRSARYIILDDLIDSGSTVDRIIYEMTEQHGSAECVGIALYDDTRSDYWRQHAIPVVAARISREGWGR